MEKGRQVFIYILRDPRCGSVRYVGKTNYPKRRAWDHSSKQANDLMKKWIAGLKSLGLKPNLEVIENCLMSAWQEREIFWIEKLKSEGNCLLNQTRGGNGTGCHLPETVQHMTAFQNSPARKAFQVEVARKLHREKPFTDGQRAKFLEWVRRPETRAENGRRLSGLYKDPVFVAKRNAALRKKNNKPVNKICPATRAILQQFPSLKDAAASVPVSRTSMNIALDKGRLCQGFYWRFPEGVRYEKKPRCKGCNKMLHNCQCATTQNSHAP